MGIETMASASGRHHDAHSPAAEDTVVSLGIRQSDSLAIIGNSDEVTLGKSERKKGEGLRNFQQMHNILKVL